MVLFGGADSSGSVINKTLIGKLGKVVICRNF